LSKEICVEIKGARLSGRGGAYPRFAGERDAHGWTRRYEDGITIGGVWRYVPLKIKKNSFNGAMAMVVIHPACIPLDPSLMQKPRAAAHKPRVHFNVFTIFASSMTETCGYALTIKMIK